jgi:hypothetical protein
VPLEWPQASEGATMILATSICEDKIRAALEALQDATAALLALYPERQRRETAVKRSLAQLTHDLRQLTKPLTPEEPKPQQINLDFSAPAPPPRPRAKAKTPRIPAKPAARPGKASRPEREPAPALA